MGCPLLQEGLKAFFTPVPELSRFLVEELTEANGLSPDAFIRLELTESNSNCTGRMNHYPVCPESDAVLGIPSHGDTQMMTILHQAYKCSKTGSEWASSLTIVITFFVNVGDTFMALTNGIVHSAAHRAVVNAKKDKYSTISFYGIDNTTTLTVPPELITEDHLLKYRPFTIKEHRKYIVDHEVPLNATRHLQIDPNATT